MPLARSRVTGISLSLSLLLLPAIRGAQTTVEVYPGPGVNTYQSSLYTVEVFDGAAWVSPYVYQFSRKSVTFWRTGGFPTVSFATFGTTGAVDVRVGKIAGAIASVDVGPHSRNIPVAYSGGRAILTLNPNDKAWITIDGDDANPLFVFADAPKPAVPAGATYFGPGVRDIAPAAGNHYKPSSNEVIYLDGGAWVRGNIDVRGTSNVQVMGPGVLSGELWTGETIAGGTFDDFLNYAMFRGDFYPGNGARVQGITIVDSPGYNFFGGATNVNGVKILSPWFYSTDGFQGVSHVDRVFCFNGDNVFTPGWAGVQNDNMTYTRSFVATTENAVFAGGYWGNAANNIYTSLADDIDIRSYVSDAGGPPLLAAAFQVWMDNTDSTKGYRNQTYQNIRIEAGQLTVPVLSVKNVVYPWGGPTAVSPPLGNGYNLVFKNISVTGTQKHLSEIKGWDANNGLHNVYLDNFRFNGELVTQDNLGKYFDVNGYVWGLSYSASPPTPTVGSIVATSGPAPGGSSVVITGVGFADGAAVSIGGAAATNVQLGGPTAITCRTPSLPAGSLNEVVVTNSDGHGATLAKGWFADFSDVPQTYLYHGAVEKIVRAGITAGCGAGKFCPNDPVTRDAMAKFLLVAAHGPAFDPPAATGAVFCDVTASTLLAKWIEELRAEGIASGAETGACGEPNYHPRDPVTRDAMAKFLELARNGSPFSPPAATGTVFCDVDVSTFLAKWIEQLERDKVTSGCGPGLCGNPDYCPAATVTRGEMAKFLSNSFGLPLLGP